MLTTELEMTQVIVRYSQVLATALHLLFALDFSSDLYFF